MLEAALQLRLKRENISLLRNTLEEFFVSPGAATLLLTSTIKNAQCEGVLIWPQFRPAIPKSHQVYSYTLKKEGEQKYQHFSSVFWVAKII